MPFWFSRKKPAKPGQEKTEGGSTVYRYEGEEFSKSKIGFTDESTFDFSKEREALYDRYFGKCDQVYHEVIPLIPHIDVYTYTPGHSGRDFYTLVTGGMSDLRMNVPPQAKGMERAELIFYCSEPKQEYINLLRVLAHFPHDHKTWLGQGHTMPNGQPPAPIFGSRVLDTFFFMPTIVKPDSNVQNDLKLKGDPVSFLWLVPLSTAECDLKLKNGTGPLYDLFEANRHPHIFNPNRHSYV